MMTTLVFQRNISRAQILFLCVFFLLAFCGFILTSHWRTIAAWRDDNTEDDVKYETIGNQLYIRDHRGFLYPKGYFDVPPNDTNKPFKDVNLAGQHSDTVLPECDEPTGVDPGLTNQNVGWIEPPKYRPDYKNPCWFETDEEGNETVRCIPFFYLIGMAKSGSSDLFNRIQQHPHVEKSPDKEQRWFDAKRFDEDNKRDFSFYFNKFQGITQRIETATNDTGYHHHICGDGSPSYSWDNIEWYKLPENQYCLEPRTLILSYIHHLTPRAKLILILRNPVDRLYSHYLYHSVRTGAKRDPREFHDWVKETLETYQECYKTYPFRFCMYSKTIKESVKVKSLTSSIYSRLILDVLKIFPREQLLILEMMDYSKHLNERLKEVFEFLELEPVSEAQMMEIAERKQKNAGKFYGTAGPMLNKTRKMLTAFFQPFNEELAQIMDDDKYLWLDD